MPFFAFPDEIRKVIYTTNAIESINRQIRKILKNKIVFPDDKSIYKDCIFGSLDATKGEYSPQPLSHRTVHEPLSSHRSQT